MLASRSPRRAEILRRLGIPFELRPVDVDETLRPNEEPAAAARRLARSKAEAARRAGCLVLGCDTLVALESRILGKPADPAEAAAMLSSLSGREHVVFTGLSLAGEDRTETSVEATRVRFRTLEEEEIADYVASGEPFDKAGGYGIQERGAALVAGIEGDYFNVMGLPVQRLLDLLGRRGLRYRFGAGLALSGPPGPGPGAAGTPDAQA